MVRLLDVAGGGALAVSVVGGSSAGGLLATASEVNDSVDTDGTADDVVVASVEDEACDNTKRTDPVKVKVKTKKPIVQRIILDQLAADSSAMSLQPSRSQRVRKSDESGRWPDKFRNSKR